MCVYQLHQHGNWEHQYDTDIVSFILPTFQHIGGLISI